MYDEIPGERQNESSRAGWVPASIACGRIVTRSDPGACRISVWCGPTRRRRLRLCGRPGPGRGRSPRSPRRTQHDAGHRADDVVGPSRANRTGSDFTGGHLSESTNRAGDRLRVSRPEPRLRAGAPRSVFSWFRRRTECAAARAGPQGERREVSGPGEAIVEQRISSSMASHLSCSEESVACHATGAAVPEVVASGPTDPSSRAGTASRAGDRRSRVAPAPRAARANRARLRR